MVKTMALVFGVIFVAVGILGFVPGITTDGHLLGVFHVNTAHNVVHILSGVIAIAAGMTSVKAARVYFRVFGLVYGLVAVLGFVSGDRPVLGLIANNMADNWLHVGIALVSLILGFLPASATGQTNPAEV